jgi:hypothetical protein
VFPKSWGIPKSPWMSILVVMVIHDLDGARGTPWNGNLHFLELFHKSTCSYGAFVQFCAVMLNAVPGISTEAYRSAVIHESKVGGHGYLSRPQMTCENQRLPKDAPLLSPPSAFLLGKKWSLYHCRNLNCTWKGEYRVNLNGSENHAVLPRLQDLRICEAIRCLCTQVTFLFSRVSYICYPWRSTWDCFARPCKTMQNL